MGGGREVEEIKEDRENRFKVYDQALLQTNLTC